MKRTEKRERTLRRGGSGTSLRPSFFRRVLFLLPVVLATSALLVFESGCRSFFVKDFEHGRYFNGRDATSDWERARMESLDGDDDKGADSVPTLQANSTYPDEDGYTTRGAIGETSSSGDSSEPAKRTWGVGVRNAFWNPFSGKKSKDEELESDLIRKPDARGREQQTIKKQDREILGNSSESSDSIVSEERPHAPGFWTKLFPSKSDKSIEDELIAGRSVEKTIVPKSRQKAVVVPSLSKKTPSQKPWNRPGLVVEQYNQSRFIPSMKTIEVYYSVGSVAVDRRAIVHIDSYAYGDAATRDVSESFASRRATALRPRGDEISETRSTNSYHSNSYAPPETSFDADDEQLPEAPSKTGSGYLNRRVGSASLTPAAPYHAKTSHNPIAQTSGGARSKNYGQTRPISSVAPLSRNPVASTSFTERRQFDSSQEASAQPESLVNAADTSRPKLNSSIDRRVGVSSRRDVDETFRQSLGSQKSYEWFDSDQLDDDQYVSNTGQDGVLTNERADRQSVAERSSGDVSFPEPQESNELSVLNAHQFPNVNVGGANFDGYSEPYAADSVLDGPSEQTGDGEIDLDVIVDDVIANAEYDEPEQRVFSSSTVSGGAIASDLASAIMENVDSGETLENQASALSESAPESLDARKSEPTSAAPLTREEIAWIEQIKNAIQSLLVEREEHKRRGDDVRICDARLRLLYLVIGEYERSIQEIEDESDPLRVFWEKECRGLETLLQNQLEEIDPTFVAERLRSGLDSFAGLCQLRIRKTLLVEAPACYGLFEERVDPYNAGEPLYAYSELDYVTSRETADGFSIDVECRWRLLDAKGTPLTSFETQRCRNLSETKLRDVVLNVSVPLSENLEPGVYLLELEVSDLNATKPETCVQRLTVRIVADGAESESVGATTY